MMPAGETIELPTSCAFGWSKSQDSAPSAMASFGFSDHKIRLIRQRNRIAENRNPRSTAMLDGARVSSPEPSRVERSIRDASFFFLPHSNFTSAERLATGPSHLCRFLRRYSLFWGQFVPFSPSPPHQRDAKSADIAGVVDGWGTRSNLRLASQRSAVLPLDDPQRGGGVLDHAGGALSRLARGRTASPHRTTARGS